MSELVSYTADELINQMRSVSDAEVVADKQHRDNILSLKATPDEVEEWYFAADPVDETHRMVSELLTMQGDQHALREMMQVEFERFVLYIRGGTTLLASQLFPKAFQSGQENRWHEVISEAAQPLQSSTNGNPRLLSSNGVLELAKQHLRENPVTISQDNLPRLYRSAEMLRSGAANILMVASKPKAVIDNREGSQIDELIANGSILSESVLRYISQYGTQETDPITGEPITDATRMLGLHAGVMIASSWMGEAPNSQPVERDIQGTVEFHNLVGSMQNLFDNPDTGLRDRLRSPDVKGPLHEALWFLDAYALRMMDREKYGDILVVPSYSCGDEPRIGHPELRRGYDYLVRNLRTDTRDYIQLKAGNGSKGKPYHPAIWELREPNFMEVNPRRLSRKLQVFREWAEAGFEESGNALVSKYIMKSVRWELDNIVHDKLDRTTALKRFFMEQVIGPKLREQTGVEKPKVNPFVKPQVPNIRHQKDPWGAAVHYRSDIL